MTFLEEKHTLVEKIHIEPSTWRSLRIGEIAQERVERASGVSNAEVYSVTKHAGFVRSLEYFGRQVFSRDTENYKVVRRGDLAYATIHLDEGSLGLFEDEDYALISPMYTVFSCDTREVDPKYLYYLMKQPWMVAGYGKIAEGSVHRRKSVSFHRLGRIEIRLPSLVEQRQILRVLQTFDVAIQLTQTVIEATEQLRKALLQDLLTHGVPGWHTEWRHVPDIGTMPACWDDVRLGEILWRTQYGTNANLSDSSLGVAVLRMGNLQSGEITLDSLKWTELSRNEYQDLLLKPGDILFNRTNSIDLVGKVSIVRDLPFDTTFASYLVRLNTTKDRANPYWVHALLNTDSVQSRISQMATKGASQANINPTSLRSLKIPLPPVNEQNRQIQLIESLTQRVMSEKSIVEVLRRLKTEAAKTMLTGRMRILLKEE